jgi:hypothetical protein
MKILHILNDGASKLSEQVINIQSEEHEIKIIDLQKKEAAYEDIVDEIFSNERVVSW